VVRHRYDLSLTLLSAWADIDFPVLSPCYKVSGVAKVEMPRYSIEFRDGEVWDLPVENYFIRLAPEEIMCLAILGTSRSALSIMGTQ